LVQTEHATATRMRLGQVAFSNMPIAFADVAPFERFGLDRKPAMLLGMNALRFFRWVDIDFANREIRLLMPRNVRSIGDCQSRVDGRCID
jgi:hypothetical protein